MNKLLSTFTALALSTTLGLSVHIIPAFAANDITSVRCNTFTFDATSSSDPDQENLTYFWDFGDGETSTSSVVEHTYTKSGLYDVTLSIADNSGLDCSTALAKQQVKANIAPILILKGLENEICIEDSLMLDASDSYANNNQPLNFSWDFGDGTTSTNLEKMTKTYNKGGKYKVRVTVNDNNETTCSTVKQEQTIYVNEPPVAQAGKDEVLVCISQDQDMIVNFDASGSTDVNNDGLTYVWDFGDSRKSTGITTSHKYRNLGNYDVKLVVDDGSKLKCSKGVDFVRVKLNKAPKADAGKDALACPGQEVIFDGTDSYAHIKGTLVGQWSFGDGGTSSGLKVTHRYNKAGRYEARLTVENKLNAMCPASNDTRVVNINTRPTVAIKTSSSSCIGDTVSFDASSATDADGDSLEYYWSFGDGDIMRAGSKVSHEYKTGGTYKVSVIVDDGKSLDCSTATAHATVKINTPPIADAGSNLTCCVDKATTFDASGSSDPDNDRLTYSWNFGDGTNSQGTVISHTYTKNGTYNVTVTVNDNSGTSCNTANAGFVATANSAPVPIIKIR